MLQAEFISAVQGRAARVTLGASALRKQGPGVADAARPFLAALPLDSFATSNPTTFARQLDKTTTDLQATFPLGSGSWGLARKLLNIFLREALYTRYLADRYQLLQSEMYFELPLDSITANRLRDVPGYDLRPWRGVKHLTAERSQEFQAVAASHALNIGIARVHLDAIWWGGSRNDNAV
ncbi:MAG: hypothetical protein RLZZ09_3051 [Pseudomonadota bacterium]|jgi:hypothetical protein